MPDNNFQISETLLEKMKYFIEDNDLRRTSRNLLRVFFDYLKFQDGVIDKDFDNILTDVEAVLNLLDVIADEKKSYRDKSA